MEIMEEIAKRSERKEQEKKRKAEQRKNNKHLAKMIAQELKSLGASDDSRIADIERRLAELEKLVTASSLREGTEDLQEPSALVHDTADTVQTEQAEEYSGLKLKNQEWNGREINLDIEAKRPYPNDNAWYKVTGYYTYGGEQVNFSQYPYDFFRFRNSAAIEIGEDHDKIVHLLYNAGVITKEETWKSIGVETKCICYRLTDEALEYAHRSW
jgi:hypothetical protein